MLIEGKFKWGFDEAIQAKFNKLISAAKTHQLLHAITDKKQVNDSRNLNVSNHIFPWGMGKFLILNGEIFQHPLTA